MSTYDSKGYHRSGENGGDSKPSSNDELKKLLKMAPNDLKVVSYLKSKYSDPELFQKHLDIYKDELEVLQKRAGKFKTVIMQKYLTRNLSFAEIVGKAKKYARKYKITDDEFDIFLKLALADPTLNKTNIYNIPNTTMSKTFGYSGIMPFGDKLKYNANEVNTLQEIINIYTDNSLLHRNVVLQSMLYRDCDPSALTGRYNKEKHNPYSYVHPVIAALFLPRIKCLDELMLQANIAEIVKLKNENTQYMTKQNAELLGNLVTDPNLECSSNTESPLLDIKQRAIVQTKLWDSVYTLRRGLYYNDKLGEFITALNKCNSNVFDSPDLAYVQDEGTILKRILGTFSLRPTIVSISPYYNWAINNPYVNPANTVQMVSVPMITLKLPDVSNKNKNIALHLQEALEQPHWNIENKVMVPKNYNIITSKGVLFFHIPRRFNTLNIASLSAPYNFQSLPTTASGFESINDITVNFDTTLNIMNESFDLRSVVLVERNINNRNLIIGSSTAIRLTPEQTGSPQEEGFIVYDPQGATEMFEVSKFSYTNNTPITHIPGNTQFNPEGASESFYKRASTRGTIFVYVKKNDQLITV